eukprot:scaffold1344_cov232-Alexandrium_tamarense.AAC.8
MKIHALFFLLAVVVASSASTSINDSDHHETTSLRGASIQDEHEKKLLNTDRTLAQTTRQTTWLNQHNIKRKKYQPQYGGTYKAMTWSNNLKNQASTLAKQLAANGCQLKRPDGMKYGINMYASFMMTSTLPTTSSIMSYWETNLNKGFPSNGAMTQVLWSNSRYVGCADAKSTSGPTCQVSVCYYAKAGNCNMGNYPKWKDAVVSGPGCGSCPNDFPNCSADLQSTNNPM